MHIMAWLCIQREGERGKKNLKNKSCVQCFIVECLVHTSERAGHENKFKSAFSSVFPLTLLVVDNLHD